MSIIEKYIEEEKWKQARTEIRKELKKHKNDHWLLTRLGLTYYEEKKYKIAMQYSERAIKLARNCPLVIWDYAGTLDMLGREKEAIKMFQRIIKKGIEEIAFGECGEGIRWARAIYADCHYRLALCYLNLGNVQKAKDNFEKHFTHRGKGIPSIYKINDVRKKYKEFLNAI